MHKLTGIVITKNEEEMIRDCLISLSFVDELILVDTGNTDRTNQIGEELGAKIVKSTGRDYSKFRNDGLASATGDWILCVDADERVTPLLRTEIADVLDKANEKIGAYDLPRNNIFLGKAMSHGGWGGDYVTRLFKRSELKGWHNALHEQPEYSGKLDKLKNSLIHFSHRDLSSMLDKTLFFTGFESQLRLQAKHPPVVAWRFVRVMLSEFYLRFIKLSAWKDGTEGIIDGMFQVFNTFIIYARLWELQLQNEKSRNL